MSLLELLCLPEEERRERGLFHTPAEIAQQPETWAATLHGLRNCESKLRAFLESAGLRDEPGSRPTVLLTGAGTSDYIGQSLATLLRMQWECEVQAVASTDLLTGLDRYLVPDKCYLCISFSRSGDSPEGVAVLERASRQYPEMAHLVVTCNRGSQMFALGCAHPRGYVAVLDDAVNDRSLAMTSSFTNMVVLGQCLAHLWTLGSYAPVLQTLVQAGHRFLPRAAALARDLARQGLTRVCFVGSDALAAAARESALKVTEMSGGEVQSMWETVLGLRHGPMAALSPSTLLVCSLSGSPTTQPYEVDLLRDVAAKQVAGKIVVIGEGTHRDAVADLDVEYLSFSGDVPDAYRVPLDVMLGQLLGLFLSIEHGRKPDAPSPGGVITRVVREFTIYD